MANSGRLHVTTLPSTDTGDTSAVTNSNPTGNVIVTRTFTDDESPSTFPTSTTYNAFDCVVMVAGPVRSTDRSGVPTMSIGENVPAAARVSARMAAPWHNCFPVSSGTRSTICWTMASSFGAYTPGMAEYALLSRHLSPVTAARSAGGVEDHPVPPCTGGSRVVYSRSPGGLPDKCNTDTSMGRELAQVEGNAAPVRESRPSRSYTQVFIADVAPTLSAVTVKVTSCVACALSTSVTVLMVSVGLPVTLSQYMAVPVATGRVAPLS